MDEKEFVLRMSTRTCVNDTVRAIKLKAHLVLQIGDIRTTRKATNTSDTYVNPAMPFT